MKGIAQRERPAGSHENLSPTSKRIFSSRKKSAQKSEGIKGVEFVRHTKKRNGATDKHETFFFEPATSSVQALGRRKVDQKNKIGYFFILQVERFSRRNAWNMGSGYRQVGLSPPSSVDDAEVAHRSIFIPPD